jgi:L,D-transpeptidase ErfK/SrfK
MKSFLFGFILLYTNIFAAEYTYHGQDVIGENILVLYNKKVTWAELSYEYEISIKDLKSANLKIKTTKYIKPNTEILIPNKFILPKKEFRNGIVINMAEQRLYFFPKFENKVFTYPVAMGRSNWRTPTAITYIKSKKTNPTWYVPNSIREHSIDTHGYLLPEFVPPGPNNPLGTRAIYLKLQGILIHGNNNKKSIGKLVSSGCIRMYNHNIEEMFEYIEPDTQVYIVHHPIKIAFSNNQIFFESHKPIKHNEEPSSLNRVFIDELLLRVNIENNINYNKLEKMQNQNSGVVLNISQKTKS